MGEDATRATVPVVVVIIDFWGADAAHWMSKCDSNAVLLVEQSLTD